MAKPKETPKDCIYRLTFDFDDPAESVKGDIMGPTDAKTGEPMILKHGDRLYCILEDSSWKTENIHECYLLTVPVSYAPYPDLSPFQGAARKVRHNLQQLVKVPPIVGRDMPFQYPRGTFIFKPLIIGSIPPTNICFIWGLHFYFSVSDAQGNFRAFKHDPEVQVGTGVPGSGSGLPPP